MASSHGLSFSDVEAILRHNATLIEHATTALFRLRQVPYVNRDLAIHENIKYWENVRSALKWSSGQAKQRLKGTPPHVG